MEERDKNTIMGNHKRKQHGDPHSTSNPKRARPRPGSTDKLPRVSYGDQRQQKNRTSHVGFKKIEEWNNEEAHVILIELVGRKVGFEKLLESELTNDATVLILRMLAKVCLSAFHENKAEIMNVILKGTFMSQLKTFIMQLPLQEETERNRNAYFWNDVNGFFDNVIITGKYLVETFPTRAYEVMSKTLKAIKLTIPNFESEQSIDISSEIKQKLSELQETLVLCQVELERKKKVTVQQQGEETPPNDFRQLSIYPTSEEITTKNRAFVRKNIIEGAYKSVEHYLDVQFRLLREDFVAPLREGVQKFIRRDKSRSNVKIHSHVEFVSPLLTKTQELGVILQFDMNPKLGHKNRKFLKRFMYGSLLCFTKDHFSTLIFGKIIERTPELLNKGQVVVGFAPGFDSYELNLRYLMVECNVYFEPYYQVLKALQNTYEGTFPMKKYIVDVDAGIEPPGYLNPDSVLEIKTFKVPVLCPDSWPSAYELGFDDTQYAAFRAALTQKFAVIQGPPGTGKTYLGLKIAKALIKNRELWRQESNTPILVVCYTNHALDQFLAGLIDSTNDLVRVGARSKNVQLEEFNLKVKRQDPCYLQNTRTVNGALYSLKLTLKRQLAIIKDWNKNLEEIEKYDGVVHFKHFLEIEPGLATSWFATASDAELIDWLLYDYAQEQYEDMLVEQEEQQQNENEEGRAEDWEFDEMLQAHTGVQEIDLNVDLLEPDTFENSVCTPTYLVHIPIIIQTANELTEELANATHYYTQLELQEKLIQIGRDLNYFNRRLRRGRIFKKATKPINVDLQNPHRMAAADRWMLYLHWVELYRASVVNKLLNLQTEYRDKYKQLEEIKVMQDTQIMKQMVVVGMTTTGAARLQTSLQDLKCRIVIVEEAAEVLESHIIASLTSSCEHLILIGDHQQLRPSTADFRIEKQYMLGISLFERMVRNKIQCHTLGVQHRMCPEVAKLIVPAIYPTLDNHESVYNYPPVSGIVPSVYFINHSHPEEESDDTTRRNKHEAKFLINLAYYLVQNGYQPDDITILAAYSGQMFELWKERKNKHLLLQDVHITVLDNYQGEESKIILLSLVRNNEEDKIGFLNIENRVCVALSRAKEGFYIMGNMDLLCRNSEIWPKVKEALESQGCLGNFLALRCQMHEDVVTEVQSADDFLSVPEGGCSKMCETEMSCGHKCLRICHVTDRQHKNVICKERCTKYCKNGNHKCKKLCQVDCGPCSVTVQKTLPCSHEHPLKCSVDPKDYVCPTLVHAKLPCGHEVTDKPCHAAAETFKCPFPCASRVEPCGHACNRTCHLNNDPDHLKYKCFKPCARVRKNCSTRTHMCQLKCYQECLPCDALILKLRTACFHHFKVECSINIDEVACSKPCIKTLPCGHRCQNQCSAECGNCPEMVKKKHDICGHQLLTKCSEEPDRTKCRGRCPLPLKCGHPCERRCNEPCTTKCRKLVDHTKAVDCGHKFKIECYLLDADLPSNSYQLLKFCREPCKATLECSHCCSGTCGECAQGRVHKSCDAKCGVPLICGHECPSPCRETCQPCTRRCSYKCKHSACRKRCGEPCTRCVEKCERRCKHVQCKSKCGQICTVSPCTKPCYKQLACGHNCVGFCGDPCPPLCRICNKEELSEVFFGFEGDDDARFVLLDECKHVIENQGMEKWLRVDNAGAVLHKTCPKCKTPLTSTQRYSHYVKLAFDDVVEIKKKFFGSFEENESKQNELYMEVANLRRDCRQLFQDSPTLRDLLDDFRDALKAERRGRRQLVSKVTARMYTSKIQILKSVTEIFNRAKLRERNVIDKAVDYMNFLFRLLLKRKHRITNQEIGDFERELKRFVRITQLCQIEDHTNLEYAISNRPAAQELHQEISRDLFSPTFYTDELHASLEDKLARLSKELKASFVVAREELQQIVRAIGVKQGAWYKCPNGHFYAIGDCGGAAQIGRCIECKESVGGTNHTLLRGNQHAGEIDRSRYAAWSEAANNMFNYEEFQN